MTHGGESESAWHLAWKSVFPVDGTEVVIGNHRADVVLADGMVLELQNSTISVGEIAERESFYRNMAWIVNAEPFIDNLCIRVRDGFHSFRWKWPRPCWSYAKRPIYLDLGSHEKFSRYLLLIKRLGREVPVGGWGMMMDRNHMIDQWSNRRGGVQRTA